MTDPWVDLHHGHVLDVLAELPAESVQCCVTSPPYWGLRKYQGEQDRVWGGQADCPHEWQDASVCQTETIGHWQQAENGTDLRTGRHQTRFRGHTVQAKARRMTTFHRSTCRLCGAWRGAYGLEPTVKLYVEHTVEILRAIRRVLRTDGVVWWNVGDSYASSPPGNKSDWSSSGLHGARTSLKYQNTLTETQSRQQQSRTVPPGLKPKNLCLLPQRVALAAQDDGWWVRSLIVWAKQNPMPESVRDRPTDAWEHIIMLTRAARYYYDGVAVAQAHSNLRNVWTLPTEPCIFRGVHFATFPTEIPRRCIMASTRPGDIVLDPFVGSGTTCAVAKQLGRRSIGIDISEEYLKLARRRIEAVTLPMVGQ